MAKIELGRAYQTLTGEWVVVHPKEVLFSAESCFHANTLEQYAEYVDSLRHSCQAPKCCVENSELVSAAMEGDLGKVMVLKTKFNDQTPSRNIGIATICQDLNILESQCLNLEKVQNMLRFVDPNLPRLWKTRRKLMHFMKQQEGVTSRS